MRNRDIKDRRVLIREFAYMHRQELLQLAKDRKARKWVPHLIPQEDRYMTMLRSVVPYSPATSPLDIWNYVIRLLVKYLQQYEPSRYDLRGL